MFNGTITKVEKLVDNPLIEIGGVAIIVVVIFFIFTRIKG